MYKCSHRVRRHRAPFVAGALHCVPQMRNECSVRMLATDTDGPADGRSGRSGQRHRSTSVRIASARQKPELNRINHLDYYPVCAISRRVRMHQTRMCERATVCVCVLFACYSCVCICGTTLPGSAPGTSSSSSSFDPLR